MSGYGSDDVFKPNYFYMETAEWIALPASPSWFPERLATRNIANINVSALSTPAIK